MADQDKTEKLLSFSELLELEPADRRRHELRILEGLMAQAVREKDWTGALRMFDSAHKILLRSPPPLKGKSK